jgi:hypothetical protein
LNVWLYLGQAFAGDMVPRPLLQASTWRALGSFCTVMLFTASAVVVAAASN